MLSQPQSFSNNHVYNYPYPSHTPQSLHTINPLLLKIDTKQKIKYIRSYLGQLKTTSPSLQYLTINCAECGFYDFDYVTRRRRTINDIQKDLKDNKYQTVKQICQQLQNLYKHFSQYLLMNDPLQEQLNKLIKQVGQFQWRFAEDFKQNRLNKQVANKLTKRQDNAISANTNKIGINLKQDILNNQTCSQINTNTQQSTSNNNNNPNQSSAQNVAKSSTILLQVPQPIMDYNRKSTFSQKLQMFFYLRTHEDNMEYVKSIGDGYSIGKQQIDGGYTIRLQAGVGGCLWLELLQKKDM